MNSATLIETLTRVGFAARGLTYFTIGFLALRSGRTEGSAGALAALNGGIGSALLAVMAVGFVAYAIWRLSEAAIDSEGRGTDAKSVAARIGGAVSGIVHLGLAFVAVRLATGQRSGGGGNTEQEGAATALTLPMGEWLVGLVAVALIGTGLYQFVKAAKAGFLRHLAPEAANQDWVKWTGRIGYAARGIVFVLIGFFAFRVAQQSNAAAAGGTEAALSSLPGLLFVIVAIGFAMFGIFSLVEARYRKITDPAVLKRLGARLR